MAVAQLVGVGLGFATAPGMRGCGWRGGAGEGGRDMVICLRETQRTLDLGRLWRH
jgi:hypothetical protein